MVQQKAFICTPLIQLLLALLHLFHIILPRFLRLTANFREAIADVGGKHKGCDIMKPTWDSSNHRV